MTPEDKQMIDRFNRALDGPARIDLINAPGSETAAAFEDFCYELTQLAPKLEVKRIHTDRIEGPAIQIGERIVLRAVPNLKALEMFLYAIAAVNGMAPPEPPRTRFETAAGIALPADLKLYIAPRCPFCPLVVQDILMMALQADNVHATVVDAQMFPELARADGIRSVPTLLLDGGIRWTGTVDTQELIRVMGDRDPAGLGAASLQNLLESGDAERVARMMLHSGAIYPAFVDLLCHENWPVRLGAMVVLETIAEKDGFLAAEVIEPLWSRFAGAEDAVRGDILYALGQIGDRNTEEKIRSVLNGSYADAVKEAAAEALEAICAAPETKGR